MEVIDGQSIFGHADHKRVTRKLVYLKQASRSQDRGRLISIFSAFHIPLLPQNKNWFPAPAAALPRAQITVGPPGDARAAESFG